MKNKKKIVSVMLAIVMICVQCVSMAVFASETMPIVDTVDAAESETQENTDVFTLSIGQNTASVFGEMKESDVQPIIRNDRTMLPARFVAENLGAEVFWEEETKVVTIKSADVEIKITIDSAIATVNGVEEMLDSPAFVENDRTYTPVRFIAEKLGSTVSWDEETQTVMISRPGQAVVTEPETPTVTGTLEIRDFQYVYEPDSSITELNEGAIGGMRVSGEVVGPSNVCKVRIASWSDEPLSQEYIQGNIDYLVGIWKEGGTTFEESELPFYFSNSHPVDSDELGKKMYVLLIGLDKNCNAVGYAIVEEVIAE